MASPLTENPVNWDKVREFVSRIPRDKNGLRWSPLSEEEWAVIVTEAEALEDDAVKEVVLCHLRMYKPK